MACRGVTMSKYLAIFDTKKVRLIYDSISLQKSKTSLLKDVKTFFGTINMNYQIICAHSGSISIKSAKWGSIILPNGRKNMFCVTLNRAANDKVIKDCLNNNRCIIVVDGIYIKANWNSNGLFYITDKKLQYLLLGGFYFNSNVKPGIQGLSFSILTRPTVSKLFSLTGDSTIPIMIKKTNISTWLDKNWIDDSETIESFLHMDIKIFRVLEKVNQSTLPKLEVQE